MVREVAVGSFHASVCALQALPVLAALILFIIATVGGVRNPSIAAGYVAAVWCLVVNCYLVAGWFVTKRAVSYYVPSWASYAQKLPFLSGLHFVSGCLAIVLGTITAIRDTCSSYVIHDFYYTGDGVSDEADYRACRRQMLKLFIGQICIVVAGVFHIGCAVGCCASFWQERRQVINEEDQSQQRRPNTPQQRQPALLEPPAPPIEMHGAQLQNLPTEYYAPAATERPLPPVPPAVPTEYYAPQRERRDTHST